MSILPLAPLVAALSVGATGVALPVAAAADPGVQVAPGETSFTIRNQQDSRSRDMPETEHVSTSSTPYKVLLSPVCEVGGTSVCDSVVRCPASDEAAFALYHLYADGTRQQAGLTCARRSGPPAAPPVVTDAMVLRALRRVGVPEPVLVVQPPGGRTLVNLETIFSTRAEPFSASVRIMGRRVDLRVTPRSFLWRHGDGTTQRSSTPGRTYRRGVAMSRYLTHVYTDAGVTVRPRVAVEYGARYRVDGGPWREVVGTVTSQGPAQALRVVEATPVLVTPR